MKKSLMYTLLAMVLVIVSAPFVFAAPEVAQAVPLPPEHGRLHQSDCGKRICTCGRFGHWIGCNWCRFRSWSGNKRRK